MKLLFDENISPRLVTLLETDFPLSLHVDGVGLHGKPDKEILAYAVTNGYTIVSEDSDFRQMSFVRGAPPKIIWLDIGNSSTEIIASVLRRNKLTVQMFIQDADTSFLELA